MRPLLRILGIFTVFCVTLVAWLVLGGVTTSRSGEMSSSLRTAVADLWGGPQTQAAPRFLRQSLVQTTEVEQTTDATGRPVTRTIPRVTLEETPASASQSRIDVGLHLDERRKGLLWFPLYDVTFDGAWTYTHDADAEQDVRLALQFPDASAKYDDFHFRVDGVDLAPKLTQRDGGVDTVVHVQPGQVVALAVHYVSRGMTSWTYTPTDGVGQIRDLQLAMHTDFHDIDYPSQSLSPSTRDEQGDGWTLTWAITSMYSGQGIGMIMPTHVQPGELASALSFSAPIPLGLFFVWIFVLGLLRGIEIHPVNYLFLAAAFFSFNLLFAYTADHVAVEWAFALSSVVSVGLVVSYLRLVVGPRFAFVEAGVAQLLYQVGFGLAHFAAGFTGLTITVLGILTLFALMQLTGRIAWGRVLAGEARVARS